MSLSTYAFLSVAHHPVDAFVAGPNQSFENPFGDIPENLLHHWMFDEPEKHQAQLNALTDAGAFIIGSNMYGTKEAAWQRNVAIMGGANTINQFLSAGLLDELWLHIVPVTIGEGARLFENVPNLQLEPLEISGTPLVTHIRYRVVKK